MYLLIAVLNICNIKKICLVVTVLTFNLNKLVNTSPEVILVAENHACNSVLRGFT